MTLCALLLLPRRTRPGHLLQSSNDFAPRFCTPLLSNTRGHSQATFNRKIEKNNKVKKERKKVKKIENEKSVLAARGFEPGLFLVKHFYYRNIYGLPSQLLAK